MLVAFEGNLNVGELLISRGAGINATNDFGETALSLAAHGGRTRFIRALLANGTSPDCHPHGNSLGDWLRAPSGLPQIKISSILDLIETANPR
jgi:ankyrin repeat protein